MFNKGDVIELEGSEERYVVLKYFQDLGKFFIVLAKEDEPTALKFCFLDQDKVKEITDPKLIENISEKSLEN